MSRNPGSFRTKHTNVEQLILLDDQSGFKAIIDR